MSLEAPGAEYSTKFQGYETIIWSQRTLVPQTQLAPMDGSIGGRACVPSLEHQGSWNEHSDKALPGASVEGQFLPQEVCVPSGPPSSPARWPLQI